MPHTLLAPVGSARMRALHPLAQGHSNVKVLGISATSIEVLSPVSVPAGTLMQLHLPAGEVFLMGKAQYCDTVGSGFQVGIEIEDTFQRVSARGSLQWVISPTPQLATQ